MLQLGVVGLGTMGANLARNAARNGAQVTVYNRTQSTTKKFLDSFGKEGQFKGAKSYKEFVQSLGSPRVILIMVNAGDAVDAVIRDLTEGTERATCNLQRDDILIDGGNSHYRDTERRAKKLAENGIRFLGMGVSGGEEGALNGPSLMPGGDEKAYKVVEELLVKMAAGGTDGKCVSFIGPGGAGHFVKMVHNGIEYGVMQAIAESYDILKSVGNFTNEELAATYGAWNGTEELASFLMEITSRIFTQKDENTGKDLIDLIADRSGQKGTGKWAVQAAYEYGVAIPTINAAVDARILSGAVALREQGEKYPRAIDEHDPPMQKKHLESQVRTALAQTSIAAYLQGFELLRRANEEESWEIDLSEIARIWRGGCIIRSAFLPHFQNFFSEDQGERDAGAEAIAHSFAGERQLNWRRLVELGCSRGVPLPVMSVSLSWYDTLQREKLPQNLIQAQRDFFGAHTYERIDKEGTFHTQWGQY